MFKNLKDKLATQVTKTNQSLFATILPTDSTLSSRDTNNRTSSSTSHDEYLENNRSRIDSASSDISQTTSYVSPSRHFIPPSDIESEYGGNESDHETNTKTEKLLTIYKTKFVLLKNAYEEIEREKDNIKNILQQQQDTSIKRQTELRQQMKLDRQAKEQTESLYLREIKSRENKIEEFTQQFAEQKNLIQQSQEEIQTLREKNTKLGTLLVRCKEEIQTHQEKQGGIIAERDNLSQQLIEKQALIESMMKERELGDTSAEMKDHADTNTNASLYEQEQSKSDIDETIIHERDELKQKYEDLVMKFEEISVNSKQLLEDKLNLDTENKEYQNSILKDKQKLEELSIEIEILKTSLSTENEQHQRSYDILKREYEDLRIEFDQTKQAKDNIQSLLDDAIQERSMYKDKYEQIQPHEHTDDQTNAALTKLQNDYNEAIMNCTELTQKLNTQRQEHLDEIATLRNEQQTAFDRTLKELQDENNRLKVQIETDQQMRMEFENIRKEELFVLENELIAAAKRTQDATNDLSIKINERQEEIQHLQQLLNEEITKRNEYEKELKVKTSEIVELEKSRSQSDVSEKDLTDAYNSFKEQHQQSIESMEKHLEEKQNEIVQLIVTIDELKMNVQKHEHLQKTIETTQNNEQQLLEEKHKEIDTLKNNLSEQQSSIEKLNAEHQQSIDEKQEEIENLHRQLLSLEEQQKLDSDLQQQHNAKFIELEKKYNHLLSEKPTLENELDNMRMQIQTTASSSNDESVKLEQKIQELETEIETLKSEIVSLVNINEENTRRIDEFDNDKFNFEQEITEKDRQLTESSEKIQELELTVKQTQESSAKLRNALQNMKESVINAEQKNIQDAESELRGTVDDYEQRLKDQEKEYNSKLKAMAKEMSIQIEQKEQNYQQQLYDYIQENQKIENDLTHNSEQQVIKAEERALIAEQEMSKMQEQLKEKQLEHYHIVQDLQIQIQKLIKQYPQTAENSSQTTIEDIELNHSHDGHHSFMFEPTEVDYLKQIVLAYMTGTDRITMAKVICAVLRYTDTEKSLIIEHERLRQARWINSPR